MKIAEEEASDVQLRGGIGLNSKQTVGGHGWRPPNSELEEEGLEVVSKRV